MSVASEHPGVHAYCVKCKAQREMTNAQQVTLKNGRPAVRGTCSVCGASMVKIGAAR